MYCTVLATSSIKTKGYLWTHENYHCGSRKIYFIIKYKFNYNKKLAFEIQGIDTRASSILRECSTI